MDAEKQSRAVNFINNNVFNTPEWLIDQNILNRIGGAGSKDRIGNLQSYALNVLFNVDRIDRMVENKTLNGDQVYTANTLFKSVEDSIFEDVGNASLDVYRRNLQREFVSKLESIVNSDNKEVKNSEMSVYARACLNNLESKLEDLESNIHIEDLKYRIETALDPD